MTLNDLMKMPDVPEPVKVYKVYASKKEMIDHPEFKTLKWESASEISETMLALSFYSKAKAVGFSELFRAKGLISAINFLSSPE
jgi:hypothetical protein